MSGSVWMNAFECDYITLNTCTQPPDTRYNCDTKDPLLVQTDDDWYLMCSRVCDDVMDTSQEATTGHSL